MTNILRNKAVRSNVVITFVLFLVSLVYSIYIGFLGFLLIICFMLMIYWSVLGAVIFNHLKRLNKIISVHPYSIEFQDGELKEKNIKWIEIRCPEKIWFDNRLRNSFIFFYLIIKTDCDEQIIISCLDDNCEKVIANFSYRIKFNKKSMFIR